MARWPITEGTGIAAALDEGWTIPASWYTDAEILEQEHERVFSRTWQYAGHASRLTKVGDRFTCVAGRVPIVVVRASADELLAFVNVCPHRAHEIVLEDGHRQTMQCPYHGWTFNLDGSLRAAPRSQNEPNFVAEEVALIPVQVDSWGPLIFVNPDPDAGPLADTLGDMPAYAKDVGLDLDDPRYTLFRRCEYTLPCNWKLIVENSTECYHCDTVHPTFLENFDAGKAVGTAEEGSPSFSLLVPKREDVEYHRPVENYHVHWAYPNFSVQGQPPDYYYTYLARPIDANTTLFIEEYYFADELDEAVKQEEFELMELAVKEDFDATASVQRGLRSRKLPQGRAFVNEESVLLHFQKRYYEEMEGV